MSNDEKNDLQPTASVSEVPPSPGPTAPLPKLADIDKMALDLSKEQRKTALAEAKAAVSNSEKAELAYRYVVLQLYFKYGLTEADALTENGEIIKGGATKQPQAK